MFFCSLHLPYLTFPIQVTIPDKDTTYWCEGFILPEEIRNEKKHIIKVCSSCLAMRSSCRCLRACCSSCSLYVHSQFTIILSRTLNIFVVMHCEITVQSCLIIVGSYPDLFFLGFVREPIRKSRVFPEYTPPLTNPLPCQQHISISYMVTKRRIQVGNNNLQRGTTYYSLTSQLVSGRFSAQSACKCF